MKLSDKKMLDASDRAACVRRYRRWIEQRPRPCRLHHLVDELRREFRAIKVSMRSLARWHKLAGDPLDESQLIDRRTGRTGPALAVVLKWWDDYRADPEGSHAKTLAAIASTTDQRVADALARLAAIYAFQSYQKRCPDQSAAAFENFLFCLRSQFPSLRISKRSLYRWRRIVQDITVESLLDTRGGRCEHTLINIVQ